MQNHLHQGTKALLKKETGDCFIASTSAGFLYIKLIRLLHNELFSLRDSHFFIKRNKFGALLSQGQAWNGIEG